MSINFKNAASHLLHHFLTVFLSIATLIAEVSKTASNLFSADHCLLFRFELNVFPPVKAPFSYPNNSDPMRVDVKAEQFNVTNDRCHHFDKK